MPFGDPKIDLCSPFYFVEIYDNDEKVGVFRILPSDYQKGVNGVSVKFELEHALGTLLDDILFQYHHWMGTTAYGILRGIVFAYQSTIYWEFTACDFTALYSYKLENESILGALLNFPTMYSSDYTWTFSTDPITAFWTLSLNSVTNTDVESYIVYKRNMAEIKKRADPRNIATRVYALGYGDGVNQLTIENVTTGNDTYIEADAASIATYGIKSYIFVDKKEEDENMLLYKAISYMNKNKVPKLTYTVKAVDLYSLTGNSDDNFQLGTYVNIFDEELGYNVNARIVSRKKSDVTGSPGEVELDISNVTEDIIGNQTTVQSKIVVSELYSQGASNIDSTDYNDNCDNDTPAIINFYFPLETERVNKCVVNYYVTAYRTFAATTASDGANTFNTDSDGGESINTGSAGSENLIESGLSSTTGIPIPYANPVNPGHNHSFNANHVHTTSNHVHGLTTNDHSHSVTTTDHSHAIVDKVSKFSDLPPSIVMTADGNTVVGVTTLNGSEVNILPYLDTDANGKVTTGLHILTITPDVSGGNPEGLARVYASIQKNFFIQNSHTI